MYLDQETVDELNLLMRFSRSSALDSLDISEASDIAVNSAAQRLFQKGIITRSDGGKLTEHGLLAADYANQLIDILAANLEPI